MQSGHGLSFLRLGDAESFRLRLGRRQSGRSSLLFRGCPGKFIGRACLALLLDGLTLDLLDHLRGWTLQ